MRDSYRIIVIGGGHAGAEAAWAAANLLRADGDDNFRGNVALVTMDVTKIGQMSCNPAIGGLAKGQIVNEIDALGGLMALAIDAAGIQFRTLNASKGPAVRGPRAQADKYAYAREVQRLLRTRPNLDILEGTVEQIIVENGICRGVVFTSSLRPSVPASFSASAVILTTGTFMRGLMHTGPQKSEGGRVGEQAAVSISTNLRALGFDLGRLKTGTPPRLDARTIDFAHLPEQPGDTPPLPFSAMTHQPLAASRSPDFPSTVKFPLMPQKPCWLTHTSPLIHEQIKANLDRAPMYNGQITADCGPRYCPSIEDKIHRFADRDEHHVFLEPESLETHEIYCNGISTSLPADVQDFMVHHLPGCENATILRYGYAVEYDMVWPHQIDATAMTKRIPGLFLAGQINGTSGYEEAAGQGLLAGLNAVRYVRGEPLIRMGRDQSYIGVMMDDLVTKTPREPYRMFTSRAEHRLLLRSDNAVDRLTPVGREWGLVDDVRWACYTQRHESLTALEQYLKSHPSGAGGDGQRLWDWIKQPQVTEQDVLAKLSEGALSGNELPGARLIFALMSEVRYAGFIERHRRQNERLAKLEHREIPGGYDFARIPGLRTEAKQSLARFRPGTLGQASRLAGITPADLTVIAMAIER
ncbi:MAG: tRNA uridine-5-carboxymethylaminomethyl(34) synthesis enzyme MnmG [Phycisphaeraceae bacterium]